MYDKNAYRTLLRKYQKYLKLTAFCDLAGVNQTTLSLFMKGEAYDYCLSISKLETLCNCIKQYFISNA